MNYFRKYSSYFGLECDFLDSMLINNKCWLYFELKTICLLLNKHKKYVTNSCCTHHFQLFDTFRKFSTNQNFRKCNSIRNGFDTPLLRHHIAWVAIRWLYDAYIYMARFDSVRFEFILHSIQYFCSSLPIFKLPQIQQRALLFSVVIMVLNGNNTVLIQDPEHFMDTFSKQLQITKRWWIIWVRNASLKVCYVPANSQLEIHIFNIYGFLIGYLIAFTNRINTAQHICT